MTRKTNEIHHTATQPLQLHIYTDGSSLGNPGPGGRGLIVYGPMLAGTPMPRTIKKSDVLHYTSGGEQWTTNNRMELTAALRTLEWITEFLAKHTAEDNGAAHWTPQQIIIHTDSTYVHDAITGYLDRRIAKKWRLANRKPVQNRDLREQVVPYKKLAGELTRQRVKAHAASAQNNAVDRLARRAATEQQDSLPYNFVPPSEVAGVAGVIDGPQQTGLW